MKNILWTWSKTFEFKVKQNEIIRSKLRDMVVQTVNMFGSTDLPYPKHLWGFPVSEKVTRFHYEEESVILKSYPKKNNIKLQKFLWNFQWLNYYKDSKNSRYRISTIKSYIKTLKWLFNLNHRTSWCTLRHETG